MSYFIIDSGTEIAWMADIVMADLKKHGHHYINYETSEPYLLQVEEVNEDTFLDHYKQIK